MNTRQIALSVTTLLCVIAICSNGRLGQPKTNGAVSASLHVSQTVLGQTGTEKQISKTERKGYVASNSKGMWYWVPGGKYVGEVVVILGGNSASHISKLLEEGFVIWTRNIGSSDESSFDQNKWDNTLERKLEMEEAWGYLGYLSDPDDSKPTGTYLAFVSSSQEPETAIQSLKSSLTCSRITGNLSPINRRAKLSLSQTHPMFQTVSGIVQKQLQKRAPVKLASWGPEYVVPAKIVTAKKPEFYNELERSVQRSGKGVMKYIWHVLFGAPYEVDMVRGIPQCDDPLRREIQEEAAVQDHTLESTRNLSNADGHVEWNNMGIWVWGSGENDGQTLVVIGGTRHDPTRELYKWGYKTWSRNLDCQRYIRTIWGVDDTNEGHHICTESWGYLGYLSDPDTAKPLPEWVVFNHGHLQAWHQPGDMRLVLDDALNCAKKRPDRMTPVTKVDTMSVWRTWEATGKAQRWIFTWNQAFGNIRRIKGNRLQAWCCASFVLNRAVINRKPPSLYHRFLREKIEGFKGRNRDATGYFFEYTFHLIFGEPEVIDITGIEECPDFTYARDTTQGKSGQLLELERQWKRKGRPDPRPSRAHG